MGSFLFFFFFVLGREMAKYPGRMGKRLLCAFAHGRSLGRRSGADAEGAASAGSALPTDSRIKERGRALFNAWLRRGPRALHGGASTAI